MSVFVGFRDGSGLIYQSWNKCIFTCQPAVKSILGSLSWFQFSMGCQRSFLCQNTAKLFYLCKSCKRAKIALNPRLQYYCWTSSEPVDHVCSKTGKKSRKLVWKTNQRRHVDDCNCQRKKTPGYHQDIFHGHLSLLKMRFQDFSACRKLLFSTSRLKFVCRFENFHFLR